MDTTHKPVAPSASAFIPLLLCGVSLVGWLGFQTWQLVTERQQLAQLRVQQDQMVDSAAKLRASLESVATATAKLASEGNQNARTIVDELRKRGVSIDPSSGQPKSP